MMTLNPVYFGESNRQLFGMYDPSATGGVNGAVLCAPSGQEYLRAHPSIRHLARLLARSGVHVFRFDYLGTGDSDGSDLDGSLTQWTADVDLAIEELKDTADVRNVSLIGLRLGATVAAMAAKARGDIHRLVMWDPVFDGFAYLSQLVASSSGDDESNGVGAQNGAAASFNGAVTPMNGGASVPRQVRGFLVSESAYVEVASIGPRTFAGSLPRTLIMSTESREACAPLEAMLRSSGTDVATDFRAGPQAWVEIGNFGASGMPVAALQEIARWVSA